MRDAAEEFLERLKALVRLKDELSTPEAVRALPGLPLRVTDVEVDMLVNRINARAYKPSEVIFKQSKPPPPMQPVERRRGSRQGSTDCS